MIVDERKAAESRKKVCSGHFRRAKSGNRRIAK
jgi:hypothetical protein